MNLPVQHAESSAINHAEELTLIYDALKALHRGDATSKLPYRGSPAFLRVAEEFNDLVEHNANMAEELAQISELVEQNREDVQKVVGDSSDEARR